MIENVYYLKKSGFSTIFYELLKNLTFYKINIPNKNEALKKNNIFKFEAD